MATLSTDELKAKAVELNIDLQGDEDNEKLETLINDKIKSDNPPVPPANEDDDEAILALKNQVEENLKNKKESDGKTYTQKEMDAKMLALEKRLSQKRDENEEDFIDLLDPNAVKRKFIRLARLNNKFVVGMKDMNTDTYTDQPMYFTNIENPAKKGDYIPWATFIYEDGTTELYPYLSFMNRAVGVWAEVIKEDKKDVSETFGVVDVKAIDESNEWDLKNTGRKVLAKALKYNTIYLCKEIKGGKDLEIEASVVNKVEAPWSDLKKFLEETK